ncbi:MAG: hypothetical protein OXR64_05240 [Chloroflexota bacterium]|nr:hypothetical protein [Chloroflexota bacterium]
MEGDPLPDDDHVARYCKPSSVGANGLPLASAFQLRASESSLSVNWLEALGAASTDAVVDRVRALFVARGFGLRANGRFAVLNVGAAKAAVREELGLSLRIEHDPLFDDPSHAAISGFPADNLAVAVELTTLVSREDTYPAIA